MSSHRQVRPYQGEPITHRDLELNFNTLAESISQVTARGEKPQILAVGKGLMLKALELAKFRELKVAFLAGLGPGAWFICSRQNYQRMDWALVAAPGRTS